MSRYAPRPDPPASDWTTLDRPEPETAHEKQRRRSERHGLAPRRGDYEVQVRGHDGWQTRERRYDLRLSSAIGNARFYLGVLGYRDVRVVEDGTVVWRDTRDEGGSDG